MNAKEFKQGASDYDALQIVYTFIKQWRNVDWETDRDKAQEAIGQILESLHGDPKYNYVKFLLYGYDYARDKETDNAKD